MALVTKWLSTICLTLGLGVVGIGLTGCPDEGLDNGIEIDAPDDNDGDGLDALPDDDDATD